MTTEQIHEFQIGDSFNFIPPGANPIPLKVSEQTSGDKFVGVDDKGVTFTWILTGVQQIAEINP